MIEAKHKWRIVTYLLLAFFILQISDITEVFAQKSNKIYVYDRQESAFSQILTDFLKNKPYWEVKLYILNDTFSIERFLKILQILKISGVDFVPMDICISCMHSHLSWNEILTMYASPLMAIFNEDKLVAVTVQVSNRDILNQAITTNFNENVKIFTPYKVYNLSDNDVIYSLKELFRGQETDEAKINISNLASYVTFLALTDSVNPCTFAVFTALIFMALFYLGKMKAATRGIFFISAVFIGYYILGVGLLQSLSPFNSVDKVLATIGFVLGSFSILRGLKPRFKSLVPSFFQKFLNAIINRSYASSIMSFILGLIASFTLLPCSGGPYMVSLGLLSTIKDPVLVSLLLVFYNVLFILPLIGILVALLASQRVIIKIKVLRSKGLGLLDLINGSLLTAICLYLLLF
jgi:cytochrome c biogenesis protein CcdA